MCHESTNLNHSWIGFSITLHICVELDDIEPCILESGLNHKGQGHSVMSKVMNRRSRVDFEKKLYIKCLAH
jgi:hypothetical protein